VYRALVGDLDELRAAGSSSTAPESTSSRLDLYRACLPCPRSRRSPGRWMREWVRRTVDAVEPPAPCRRGSTREASWTFSGPKRAGSADSRRATGRCPGRRPSGDGASSAIPPRCRPMQQLLPRVPEAHRRARHRLAIVSLLVRKEKMVRASSAENALPAALTRARRPP